MRRNNELEWKKAKKYNMTNLRGFLPADDMSSNIRLTVFRSKLLTSCINRLKNFVG